MGGRHAGVFLEGGVEGGFVVETHLEREAQDGVMLFGGIIQPLLRLGHAIVIDEIEKILAELFIDDLRKMVRRELELLGQVGEFQFAVRVQFFRLPSLAAASQDTILPASR